MKKFISIFSAAALLLAGCKKAEFAGNDPTGEGLVDFTLIAPVSGSKLVLNAATPDAVINFSWNPARPGLITAPSYKIVAALKAGGDLNTPLIEFPVSGSATTLAVTQKQMDDALKAKSIPDGAATELIWSVNASNGSVTILSSSIFTITITRMKDGAAPFVLLGPLSSLTPVTINPNSTGESLKFNWTRSRAATGGPAITYKVLFAERKTDANGNEMPVNWSSPLFSITADNNGADSLATITYKRLSDSLTSKGFTSLPTPVQLKWTAVATSGTWNQLSDYTNSLVVIREVKVYIVGSATPGSWNIDQSTRMAEDPRFPGTYFTYIRLTGGNEIKFVNGQIWPPAPGAIDWGQDPSAPAGTLTDNNEANINIAVTGVYRVTVDLSNNRYYLQTAVSNGIGGMGMIGNFQGWVHPATKMNYLDVNKFILLANMNAGNEYKFHDGNDWNNSTNSQNRWFGIDEPNGFKMVVDPGSGYQNVKWNGADGLVRAYFDISDVTNFKYSTTQGRVYLIGGDPAIGNWNNSPATALPEMTYQGNGEWTINITIGNATAFKFIVEKGVWGYQYGDGGAGKAQWRNGDAEPDPPAFSISAGPHTITLNEYTRTVTIL